MIHRLDMGVKEAARRNLGPLWPVVQRAHRAGSRLWSHLAAECLSGSRGPVAACYVTPGFPRRPPTRKGASFGGLSKLTYLSEAFPHSFPSCNVLYVVSSIPHPDLVSIVETARRRGVKVVLNQNGVAYPGWHGPGWEDVNRLLRAVLARADFVLYQSKFCKLSADRFLGPATSAWQILHNAVDTCRFTPARSDPDPHRLVVLVAGSQFQYYRLDSALRAVSELVARGVEVQLLVAGRLSWLSDPEEAARATQRRVVELGLQGRVALLGPYTQEEAPAIFQRAHLLLHTQYNDACPGIVLEAMACGVPVAYSASGGVPELVGPEAGIGVPAPLDWEAVHPPNPSALAEAILKVAADRPRYARSARERAVDRFELGRYLAEHRRIFSALVGT